MIHFLTPQHNSSIVATRNSCWIQRKETSNKGSLQGDHGKGLSAETSCACQHQIFKAGRRPHFFELSPDSSKECAIKQPTVHTLPRPHNRNHSTNSAEVLDAWRPFVRIRFRHCFPAATEKFWPSHHRRARCISFLLPPWPLRSRENSRSSSRIPHTHQVKDHNRKHLL